MDVPASLNLGSRQSPRRRRFRLNRLDPAARFRDQFDFDSVDFVNFAAGLQERLNVSIPEQDYPQLATLKSAVAYLKTKTNV